MSYAGGFLQGGSQGGSQGSPGAKRGPSPLRPVIINQIVQADQAHPDAEFFVEQTEVKDVTFVGCVRSLSKSATSIAYLIEDGTGQIDVRQWIDSSNEDEGDQGAEIDNNTYVRVLGTLKTFSGKRSVNASRIKKVEDRNEINFHLVEVAYVTMYHRKGGLPGQRTDNSIADAPYNNADNPYANQAGGGAGGGHDPYSDLPTGQRRIMTFITSQVADQPEGVHVQSIVRHMKVMPLDAVKATVAALVQDGLLYEALDDDHVLPTDT